MCCRKLQKAIKVGHLPVPAFRGRALSLSATVNSTHMILRSVTTGETPQTRDRGLKTHGVVRYAPDPNMQISHPTELTLSDIHTRKSNYCGRASAAFCLNCCIKGLCAPCRLSRVIARARTRKAGRDKWPVCAILEIQVPERNSLKAKCLVLRLNFKNRTRAGRPGGRNRKTGMVMNLLHEIATTVGQGHQQFEVG